MPPGGSTKAEPSHHGGQSRYNAPGRRFPMHHIRVLTKTRPAKAQDIPFTKQALQWFNFSVDFLIILTQLFGPKVL
jgi:hypothetical protein